MITITKYKTVIVGSGCAGYNTANCLYERGITDIAIVTEGVNCGTSRNTGSDKQTYYKVSLAGNEGDSAYKMAKTLFEGGCVDGDTAMVEAADSVRSFLRLEALGVKFPRNDYGEFVGYKTDHDPLSRASSVGPYTSKEMTEALERSVSSKGIAVIDKLLAVKIVVDSAGVCGLLALDMARLNDDYGLTYFKCDNVVMAVGGPAIVYRDKVYPLSHTGFTSLGLTAGAKLANTAEWQYGLASTDFRWNVSGTYQQVLPRYISIDENGAEREFLNDYYSDPFEAIDDVFLKGYEWPFDSRRVCGSSRVDLAVFSESGKRREVYMDFTREPSCLAGNFDKLSAAAYHYLEASGALVERPIERLKIMNGKAIGLYREHGIDIEREPLRIAVCAQHHNGGFDTDKDYMTCVNGLFAAGECAGTFGIFRPGGTALNSTQVAGNRIADKIACDGRRGGDGDAEAAAGDLRELISSHRGKSGIARYRERMQRQMSENFAFIRDTDKMKAAYSAFVDGYENFSESKWEYDYEIPEMLKNRDMVITQLCVAAGMIYTAEHAGSRGGAIVKTGEKAIPEDVRYRARRILVGFEGRACITERSVRPLPEDRELWFEKVWNEYEKRRRK